MEVVLLKVDEMHPSPYQSNNHGASSPRRWYQYQRLVAFLTVIFLYFTIDYCVSHGLFSFGTGGSNSNEDDSVGVLGMGELTDEYADNTHVVHDEHSNANAGNGTSSVSSVFRYVKPSEMCEPFVARSAASMWADNIDHVHMASKLLKDLEYKEHDFIAELLRLVSTRLPASVKMVSKDHSKMERVLKKAHRRYKYLQDRRNLIINGISVQKLPPAPSAVKILVLGGSVSRGRHCNFDMLDMNVTEEECAWPGRLENFINKLAQGRLVNVYNMARGSTNSVVGNMIVENGMIPGETQHPDVVIVSYATNDQAILDPEESFQSKQTLVRSVLTMSKCRTLEYQPILLHFDDWVGGGHKIKLNEILGPVRDVSMLASYYGFALASYGEVIRDFVFGDTREYYFTAKEWYDEDDKLQVVTKPAVHPGPGMHIVTAWIISFNLLNLVTTYCGFESWKIPKGPTTREKEGPKFDSARIPGMPDFKNTEEEPGKPLSIPRTLPPPIGTNITLENISGIWRDSEAKIPEGCNGGQCPFQWWWADYGYEKPQEREERLQGMRDSFEPYVEDYGGWYAVEDHAKVGWIPDRLGSTLLMSFKGMAQPNSKVVLLYMRSYGPEWQSSVDIELSTRATKKDVWKFQSKTELKGFHSKRTSEVYVEQIRLPSTVQKDSRLRFSMRLAQGEKFKLMGLLVCS